MSQGNTRRTAVVTGAGSGIGRASALYFAKQGYQVFALGKTLSKVNETIALATTDGCDARIFALCADVTKPADLADAFSKLDKVDVLVANAGVCLQAATGTTEAEAVWQKVIKTNLDGTWYTLNALADKLSNGAKVALVSSGLGKLGRAEYTAYAASKHGMLGMMKCLALEWAHRKINVNAVCPGWVETEMSLADLHAAAAKNSTSVDEEERQATAQIPIGRFVSATEVAMLIGWLCSDAASAITGQACNISGGEFGL